MSDYVMKWPPLYEPLPDGYSVEWIECVEHYMCLGPQDIESPIFSNRFAARRWCFAHAAKTTPQDPSNVNKGDK